MARHCRHAATLDTDCRQDAPKPHALGEPQLAGPFLRDRPWTRHLTDSYRNRNLRDRIRLRRSPSCSTRQSRPEPDVSAGAANGRGILSPPDCPPAADEYRGVDQWNAERDDEPDPILKG